MISPGALTIPRYKDAKERRSKQIFDMWLACHTHEEIALAVGMTPQAVSVEIKERQNLAELPKFVKVLADFADEVFEVPLYDVWKFKEKSHAANLMQR